MKQLIFAMALMLMLVGSAAAQSDVNFWQGSNLYINKLEGVETSSGIVDTEDNIVWGNTYTVRNETGIFTISFNREAFVRSSVRDVIVSGSWTMTVYKNGEYSGTLYGDVASGQAQYNYDETGNVSTGLINAKLRIKGGTDNFANVTASEATAGNFTGYVKAAETRVFVLKAEGSIDLTF